MSEETPCLSISNCKSTNLVGSCRLKLLSCSVAKFLLLIDLQIIFQCIDLNKVTSLDVLFCLTSSPSNLKAVQLTIIGDTKDKQNLKLLDFWHFCLKRTRTFIIKIKKKKLIIRPQNPIFSNNNPHHIVSLVRCAYMLFFLSLVKSRSL